MTDAKWTPEQSEAINEWGRSLLVAAAAGAGKTAVLVERIIRKITHPNRPVDIDRLLIVTFTSAAAAEMRERIGDALSLALEKDPGNTRLQRQMTLLNKASIMTIHSFCLEVIRNNFHYLDLDPAFRIADETETVLLKAEVLEELFEDRYELENGREAFLELVECYGGSRDDRLLQDMVLTVYEFVQSHPWPEEWLYNNSEAFNIPEDFDFGESPWGRLLIKVVSLELEGLCSQLNRAITAAGAAEGLEPYLTTLYNDLEGLEALAGCCKASWEALYNSFNEFSFSTLLRCGKNADKAVQEQVKAMRNDVKERVLKIREDLFTCGSQGIAEDMQCLYPLMKALAGLVIEFGERYAARKKEKSLLDFNDLEHFCLDILTEMDIEAGESFGRGFPAISPSRAARALQERYEEILVDEYQDSNLVQEVILNSISRKGELNPNIFMVGDVKQSIYRFRQARPELFLEKYASFPLETGGPSRKIQLYKNFRSREEVIYAVNCVFRQVMSRMAGEIDYDDTEALNPGAVFEPCESKGKTAGGPVELHLLDLADATQDTGFSTGAEGFPEETEDMGGPENEVADERPDNIQLEARLAVARIREFVQPGEDGSSFNVYDKGLKTYRPVEYRDIVILLRTTRNWSGVYMEELAASGIPAYADTGTGYFATVEVQIILSLLQIIDNPLQDIPLLSVLRSPIAGFTAEELIEIRLADRENTFYEAMRKLELKESDDTAEKVRGFLQRLGGWRERSAYMPVDELIWYLYHDTGYYSYAGAMPGGTQRQANLRILFERARKYQETSYKGLFNFINFIGKLRSGSGDMGSAKILGENENVVRIMSIHKSKGLEFPVVIAAGCGKKFNMQDLNRSILLHQDLGFGPELVDCTRRLSYPTLAKQAIRQKIRLETLSEEMRILYVAFTRAKEKLIITGTVKNLAKSAASWGDMAGSKEPKLPEYAMLKAGCYLDWVVPSVMRHRDGAPLRQAAAGDNQEFCLRDDPSKWVVRLWKETGGQVLCSNEPGTETEGWILSSNEVANPTPDHWADSKDQLIQECRTGDESAEAELPKETGVYSGQEEEINRRLSWKYPWELSSKIPTKVSVTEVKRRYDLGGDEDFRPAALYMQPLVKKPAFLLEEKEPGGAERGTIIHFVMQHLDLGIMKEAVDAQAASEPELALKTQLADMMERELLTEQQVQYADTSRIIRFFRSALGRRLLAAKNVMREIPFNLELKCTEVYRDLPVNLYGDELVLMQGVVDCYFEEEDGLVVLDYKTDYVPPEGAGAIKERYRLQLEYYKRALTQITGREVKGCHIYLFGNGTVIDY